MSDTITPQQIGSLFCQAARISRSVEYADKRARQATAECEHYDWIMLAANLRAQLTLTFCEIDSLVVTPTLRALSTGWAES